MYLLMSAVKKSVDDFLMFYYHPQIERLKKIKEDIHKNKKAE
jgi:hypothetical protein